MAAQKLFWVRHSKLSFDIWDNHIEWVDIGPFSTKEHHIWRGQILDATVQQGPFAPRCLVVVLNDQSTVRFDLGKYADGARDVILNLIHPAG
jgi:hypothetical protein